MMSKQRASKGLVFTIAMVVCSAVLAAEPCPVPPKKVQSEDEAFDVAQRVAVAYHLIDKPVSCYEFDTFKDSKDFTEKDGFQFDVRVGPKKECGGDPELAPRLFSLRVYRDGKVLMDNAAYQFVKPVCPRARKHKK